MAASRSFKEYVATRFENELHNAVADYLENNYKHMDFKDNIVRHVDSAELSDITVKIVYVEDLPDMKINFNVLVEGEIDFAERNSRDDRYDQCNKWFKVACSGDLSCSLNDFSIHSVSTYDYKDKQLNPLSDALVPYIKMENMDNVAKDFLQRFYPEALQSPTPVDPMILVERMGLSVELKNITDDFSVFGQIYFADCETEYYNRETGAYEKSAVSAGTIFVDKDAYFLRNLGSVNNTIVHECVHWDKHRKTFELERLFNEKATQIKCKVVGGVKDNQTRTEADWMEWQANLLAPRIQMPAEQTKAKAAELIKKYSAQYLRCELIDIIEPVIDELSVFFGVSRHAAKVRLIDLGYEEAIGAFTYIDGRYVKPHTFKKGTLQKNQTYSISEQDAIIESVINPTLNTKLKSGDYIFVDSHFCLNHPKYVNQTTDGELFLTDYARYHIDECCLVFDLKVKATNKYGEKFYTECVLYRDADSGIVFEAHYNTSGKNDNADSHAEILAAYNRELVDIIKRLPGGFAETLDELIKYRKTTNEKLAEACLISSKTVQRMRNNEDYEPSLETIMALCIGLQLPPVLSDDFIRKSGCSLKNTTELHMTYRFLLNSCYTKSIHDCNEILIKQNFNPLSAEE